MNDYMIAREVAVELGVSTPWVYANADKIGYLQIGGNKRFSRQAVSDFIKRNTVQPVAVAK